MQRLLKTLFLPVSLFSFLSLLAVSLYAEDEENPPVTIKHMVVFGNAQGDTGNTRELFDELSGRKKPSRLREDIRYHGPDIIDAGSSAILSALIVGGAYLTGLDKFLQSIPYIKDHGIITRAVVVSGLSTALYQTGVGHYLAKPFDYLVDKHKVALGAILWLYPSIGLPVLPPGQIYNQGGRFTNGSRVWSEILAKKMGLNADKPSEFVSLAYAGSHIRQRFTEDDMLSLGSWVHYMDIGLGVANTLLSKASTAKEKEGFWSRASKNMSEEGRDQFEEMIKEGLPPSFEHMVKDFGNHKKYTSKRDPETTLYVIAFGSDDYVIDEAEPEEVVQSLMDSITTLIERDNAKHILINELSPLMLPAVAQLPAEKKSQLQKMVNKHNNLLESTLPDIQEKYPDTRFVVFSDTGSISRKAEELKLSPTPCLRPTDAQGVNPADYNMISIPRLSKKSVFTDTITEDGSSLKAASRFIGKTVAQCKTPEKHLFYDTFNMTSRGHRMMAEIICELLREEGYVCKI